MQLWTCGLCMKGLPTSWLAQPQEPGQWSQEKIIGPLSQPYNRPYVTHVYTGTMTHVFLFSSISLDIFSSEVIGGPDMDPEFKEAICNRRGKNGHPLTKPSTLTLCLISFLPLVSSAPVYPCAGTSMPRPLFPDCLAIGSCGFDSGFCLHQRRGPDKLFPWPPACFFSENRDDWGFTSWGCWKNEMSFGKKLNELICSSALWSMLSMYEAHIGISN